MFRKLTQSPILTGDNQRVERFVTRGNHTLDRLNADERKKLKAWQTRMILFLVITMVSLAAVVGVDFFIGFTPQAAWCVFIVLIALTLAAVFIQFRQRCPRCGYRLGFQSRLVVPDNCKKCGVGLK